MPIVEAPFKKVTYEGNNLLEICEEEFSANREFIVVCREGLATTCRKAATLFVNFDSNRPRGWRKITALLKLGVAGMQVSPLMALCNRALLLGWKVTVLYDDDQILFVSPQVVATRDQV